MDGWIGGIEIASRFGHKIVIAGLSAAGKTAVKRIFFRKQKTEDVDKLPATVDYERMTVSISDIPITIVDLGGQKVFIKRFLNNFSPFVFSSVHIFIFVIDVSAKSTLNNAVQYFSSCVERINEYSPEAEFFILLHKNDLVINLPNYESIHAQLKEKFQLESTEKLRFFRTTIFKPETVIDAFGRIFEIVLPELDKSEYINERQIEKVEEYAEKYAALELQDAYCPKCGNTFVDIGEGLLCNFCGYKRILGEIPDINKSKAIQIDVNNGVGDDSVSLGELQSQMKDLLAKERINGFEEYQNRDSLVIEERIGLQSTSMPATYLHDAAVEETNDEAVLTPITGTQEDQSLLKKDFDRHTAFLTEFYGIKVEEAEKLVEGNHDEDFQAAVRSGMPVGLLLNIFLKYYPYLKENDVAIGIISSKLFDLFLAHLQNKIREDDILDGMFLIAENPDYSVEEIIQKNLLGSLPEKRVIAEVLNEIDMKEEITSEIEIGELDENVIPLSKIDNIGFKAEKEGTNCRLIFFHGKNRIGSNIISKFASIRELKYLLSFEVQLPVEININKFIDDYALKILKTMEYMFDQKEMEDLLDIKDSIEADGKFQSLFIPLLENHNVLFQIKLDNDVLNILFEVNKQSVGKLEVTKHVTAMELMDYIRSKTLLLAIISENDLIFATQVVFSAIELIRKKMQSDN
ncbi:MAG: ADP-ribosylation factor-like protein [Candidatus Hodarchaeales archaeon]|jgi:GTPase SAR1 family protein